MKTNLPPEIKAAVDAANRARALAWLPEPPMLCGRQIRHFTPRMRLDLELAGNAFASGRAPRKHDVFAFLWRLNPAYAPMARPHLAKRRHRLGVYGSLARECCLLRAFGAVRPWRAYLGLERHVAKLNLIAAMLEIFDFRRTVFRDRPAGTLGRREDDGKLSLIPPPEPHWLDNLVEWFGVHFHAWTWEEVLDAPFVRLYQLHRCWCIEHGVDVIDEIAELANDYAAQKLPAARAAAAKAAAGRN